MKRCIFLALETIVVPFKLTMKTLHMYTITLAHTELLFPLHFLKYQFKLFAHSHHRSLDETVLRCILQLSARYYWSLFFYCFPIKMNINVCLHIHVLVTLNIMESAY